MENVEIVSKVVIAIEMLLSNDKFLLENDLSERSVAHKLAEYLQLLFLNHNVDCEYNGNVDTLSGKKRISILKSELEQRGLLKVKEAEDIEEELADRQVFPDIIIHNRGTNENNLCIIEIKKSTSKVSIEYDELKLKSYTTENYGNDLKYKIGLFIEFESGSNDVIYNIRCFVNGLETDEY
jgi:hypothetical protein